MWRRGFHLATLPLSLYPLSPLSPLVCILDGHPHQIRALRFWVTYANTWRKVHQAERNERPLWRRVNCLIMQSGLDSEANPFIWPGPKGSQTWPLTLHNWRAPFDALCRATKIKRNKPRKYSSLNHVACPIKMCACVCVCVCVCVEESAAEMQNQIVLQRVWKTWKCFQIFF